MQKHLEMIHFRKQVCLEVFKSLWASHVVGVGSVSGWGTEVPHVVWPSQKIKNKKTMEAKTWKQPECPSTDE